MFLRISRFISLESVLILIAILSRLIPHAPNFTAVGAVALFAGYLYSSRRDALLISMGAILISDLYLGFYPGMLWVYGAFALTVLLGALMKIKTVSKFSWIQAGTFNASAAVLFFIVTNFGVWLSSGMYAHTITGVGECFVAAIPFFGNTLASQMIFAGALFAAHRLHLRYFFFSRAA